ncbi:FtsX-like permease family protein [Deltaproteobacteria bacterium TL4]
MKIWIKLALKEVRNNAKFSLFFIANLSLGLMGFVALDSFKTSLEHHLSMNSKAILTADMSLSSQLPFKDSELQELTSSFPSSFEESQQVNFYSMVANAESQSRLVQVVAVNATYPLYGEMELQDQGVVSPSLVQKQLQNKASVWLYPELLTALNLKVGAFLKIGEQTFELQDVILKDPSNAFSAFGLAPKVYIGMDQMGATELLKQGSRISYHHFYKFKENINVLELAEQLNLKLDQSQGSTPWIRVQTHQDAGESLGRGLNYLNDYLGLIALVALFLASIGAAYLFRSFISERFREMAILMSLGASRKETYFVVLLQITMLGLISASIAVLLGLGLLPLLPLLLKDFLPVGFENQVNERGLFLALAVGTGGSVIFCWPVLARLKSIQPLMLLHETQIARQDTTWHWKTLLHYLPLMLLYWGLAVWQAHSWIIGSSFTGILVISLLLLGSLGVGIFSVCGWFSQWTTAMRKIALRNLSRNKMSTVSCFLAISLGTLLMNLIPQLQQGLQREISSPEGLQLPSFFLFDIQPEQVERLTTFVQQQGYLINSLSPMIRARLEQHNGEPFQEKSHHRAFTREQQQERHSRNRGFNLSYRTTLSDTEKLVEGRPLATEYNSELTPSAEVSLEDRFAERLGINIGDTLTFDVQGVPVEAQVINLRRVKWNSFQPNFFVLFQPGVLEDAPKTFLASIPSVEPEKRLTLQNQLVQQFPNISMIDVTRIVDKILDISDQMTLVIQFMAWFSIMAGLVVVFSIARHEVQRRIWEINLMKVLGANFKDIRSVIKLEFGILGFFAALFGVGLSIIAAWTISLLIFERLWDFTPWTNLLSIGGLTLLCMGVALLATHSTLRQRPLALLQAT